jgi:hypothetical protein
MPLPNLAPKQTPKTPRAKLHPMLIRPDIVPATQTFELCLNPLEQSFIVGNVGVERLQEIQVPSF